MKASIVIPTYNSAHFLPSAVNSALQQDHPAVEVVIVNDCSTDMTAQYLDWVSAKHRNIVVINNPVNRGRSESRNIGNRAASGDLLFVLDADDMADPGRVTKCVRAFRQSNADYLYGGAVLADALGRHLQDIKPNAVSLEAVKRDLFTGIVHSTACYTRKFAEKFPYRSGDAARLGVDDWTQQVEGMAAGVKFEMVPNALAIYRETLGGITNKRDPAEVKKYKQDFLNTLAASGLCEVPARP